MRRQFCWMALMTGSLLLAMPLGYAGDKTTRLQAINQAKEWVADALAAEAEGDLTKRETLLSQASETAPIKEAKWHLGLVQDARGNWRTIDEAVGVQQSDVRLSKYEQMRSQTPQSLQGQMDLAVWCLRNGLLSQARSHLNQVLLIDHDNARARRALGYQNIDGQWVSAAQIQQFEAAGKTMRLSLNRYKPAIEKIVRDLNGKNAKVQLAARTKMDSLSTPSMVPALEAYFTMNAIHASIGVEWLGKIDSVESSHALAKFALMHDSADVRELATEQLKQRPLHDYVPDLLAMMATPVSSTLIPKFDDSGMLIGYTQALSQERFDRKELFSIDTRVQTGGRLSQGQAFLEEQMTMALDPQLSAISELEQLATPEDIARQNAMQQMRNRRIGQLVATVSGTEFDGDVKSLWNWWDSHNETAYQDYKPQRSQSTSQEISYFETFSDSIAGECFVRGTLVQTSRGMKPIESIAAGDLVLSRDTTSGELDWKPVLRATTRPPEATRIIRFEGDQIQCTTGHLLWVSGEGWKKASEVREGDILHGAKEPMVVQSISNATELETFNLDVADFGTYFAGKSMVLSHDVKPRGASRVVVPGLQMISTKGTSSQLAD